jgi:hypothetical protein
MPVNGFSIGRDVSLVVNAPEGIQRFSLITGFDSKPLTTDAKVKGLDGVTRHVIFHDGWQGTFSLERQDNSLEAYWAKLEDDYYSGFAQTAATITETIQEVDGSLSQFRYDGVIFKLDDAGEKKGDKTIAQKLSFVCSRRILVS